MDDFLSTSSSALKRKSVETEDGLMHKKLKSEELTVNFGDQETDQLQSRQSEQNNVRTTNLESFILNDRKEIVHMFPGQIVWSRKEKSPFWPSMIWPTKTGKISSDSKSKSQIISATRLT